MNKKIIGAIVLLAGLFIGGVAYANPMNFFGTTATAAATTTHAFMTAGTGTTTLTQEYGTNGNYSVINKALLKFQVTATTTITAPPIKVRVEYSDDRIDWYSKTVVTTANASSTQVAPQEYTFALATSTSYTGINGGTSRIHESLELDAPARFMRIVFTIPAGGSPLGLYAEITPMKEIY